MAYELQLLTTVDEKEQGRILTMLNNKKDAKNSDRKSNMMKRLLVLALMTMSLVFAGAQAIPTTRASQGCEMTCGEPFINPSDGKCYVRCCPIDPECKTPCMIKPCDK